MQPGYLPWLGFFELMARVDVFVIYDDVPYDKGSWRNRNRIRTSDGFCWLTVPVMTKNFGGQIIEDVQISNTIKWREKHYRSMVQYYRKTKFFSRSQPFFEDLYSNDWNLLIDLDMAIILHFKEAFGIETKLIYSSDVENSGFKTDRLVSICNALDAQTYISANGAKPYLEIDKFYSEGINVVFQDYQHPVYPQVFPGFLSSLSVVDLVFNCGDASFDIIMSGSSSSLERVRP
jgi:hypothetical protein